MKKEARLRRRAVGTPYPEGHVQSVVARGWVCVCVSNHPEIACDSTCVMGGEEVKATRGTSIRFPLRSEYSSLCAMRGPRGRARRRPEGPKDSSVGLTKWLTGG